MSLVNSSYLMNDSSKIAPSDSVSDGGGIIGYGISKNGVDLISEKRHDISLSLLSGDSLERKYKCSGAVDREVTSPRMKGWTIADCGGEGFS